MIIRIEALDTLFFRDSRPFNMVDDTWASGMFPPLPSVIYGALRSAYMAQNNIPVEDIEDATKGFRITAISYIIDNQKYLPLPLDVLQESEINNKLSNAQKNKIKRLRSENKNDALMLTMSAQVSEDNKPLYASHTHLLANKNVLANNFQYLSNETDVENIENGIILHTDLEAYIKKDITAFNEVLTISSYVKSEPKIGIGLNDNTTTVQEGKLYRVEMLRLAKELVLEIELEGLKLEKQGLLKLGGEGKIAHYKSAEDTKVDIVSEVDINHNDIFKLYLTTPAIFETGYYPTAIFEKAKVQVELLSCAVGKCVNVGGFNMATRKPKELQKAVPAGSVYYFKFLSGDIKELLNNIQKGICEYRSEEGFGVAYLAKA